MIEVVNRPDVWHQRSVCGQYREIRQLGGNTNPERDDGTLRLKVVAGLETRIPYDTIDSCVKLANLPED